MAVMDTKLSAKPRDDIGKDDSDMQVIKKGVRDESQIMKDVSSSARGTFGHA